jgi:hypothetical protein
LTKRSAAEGEVGFWRDHSGRLTFDLPGIAATDFPAVCRSISDALSLVPNGDIIVGLDQIFWNFRRGNQVVGFDWDNWLEFMVVARLRPSRLCRRLLSG